MTRIEAEHRLSWLRKVSVLRYRDLEPHSAQGPPAGSRRIILELPLVLYVDNQSNQSS